MLTKEQATMTLKEFVRKDKKIVFSYKFPLDDIPKNLIIDEIDYLSMLNNYKELYCNDIIKTIKFYYLIKNDYKMTDKFIEFSVANIDYYYIINKIESSERELNDSTNKKEIGHTVDLINYVKESTEFIIEEAKTLIEIKEAIDSITDEYKNIISDKSNWG
jgi:hypothetical protein